MLYSLIISDKEKQQKTLSIENKEIVIGRSPTCDVVLEVNNVSKQHTKIILKDSRFVVADLKSTNGTYINGRRITQPQVLKEDDKIYVGDFIIQLELAGEKNPPPPPPAREKIKKESKGPKPPSFYTQSVDLHTTNQLGDSSLQSLSENSEPSEVTPLPKTNGLTSWDEEYISLMKTIHERLLDFLDLRRMDINKLEERELWQKTEEAIKEIIQEMVTAGEIDKNTDYNRLLHDVLNEALGLGPLEDFLAEPAITEIMVNNARQIFVERDGRIEQTTSNFSSNQAVMGVIERIVSPIGRRIDESSPMVDARLKDGSRVNAVIPPLAINGPCLTIRKFKKEMLLIDDLVNLGTLTEAMGEFLEICVQARKNIIIAGGTGSGKTTHLNILSSFVPVNERIITIEDAAELQIVQPHVVSLEARPPNIEGKGEITIRDLVRNALRMRPDRIVVGECRGGEALDMLQAMNTGHDGSLTTVHANSPRDVLSRLETMVLMSGMDLPIKAVREQVASAVDIIVQQNRFPCGSRKVVYISEVTGMETDIITLQDIFYFKQEGYDQDNRVQGSFTPTGFIPRFYDDMQRKGVKVSMSIFH